jgi:hypothetical protein
MNTKKTIVTLFAVFSMAVTSLSAAAADLPKMPPSVDVQGHTLHLNGKGLRTATIFNVNVYQAGLYLARRSSDAQQVINSTDPRVVRLTFLRNVTGNQVRDAWNEDFKKNCQPNCAALQPAFNDLVSRMTDAKTGDVFAYIFTPKGIHIIRNGQEVNHSDNPELAKTVLSFWLGKQPPSTDLKQAMLGLVPNEDVS